MFRGGVARKPRQQKFRRPRSKARLPWLGLAGPGLGPALLPHRIFPNRLDPWSAPELIFEIRHANLFNLVRERARDICMQKLMFLYTTL